MCSLEFPDLETQFWQAHKDQGLIVVGINSGGLFTGDGITLMEQFVSQTGVTFPVGWDTSRSYGAFVVSGISPFPLDVVIDRNGRVAYVASEYDATSLHNAVMRALEQPVP